LSESESWTETTHAKTDTSTHRGLHINRSVEQFIKTLGADKRANKPMPEPLNIIRLVKDGHTYIFKYTDANRDETLRQIALFAAHEELNLTWYDAAKLSKKIRQQPQEQR
jgi:hypothetical protein